MCGIVGIVSQKNIIPQVLQGLKKLEYRGYDSAGIAVIEENTINTIKEAGKIANLEKSIAANKNFTGNIAIGHTRWATHGQANTANSHPHCSDNIAVVHNGIIENYQEIKEMLLKNGVKFHSQTDSEVIPHLISHYLKKSDNIKDAVLKTIKEIKGAFALGIIFRNQPDLLIAAKKGSPLIIGYGENENYIASDYFALDNFTSKACYLQDGDLAFITNKTVEIFDINNQKVSRQIHQINKEDQQACKGDFEHFMLKEIFEQPKVAQDSINQYLDIANQQINLPNFPFDLAQFNKITIIACGTSYYAAKAAKYLIEYLAKISVEIDLASEFRYRDVVFQKDNLMLFISQSGETADTIAALKFAKAQGQKIISIVNVAQSTMAYLSDAIIRTMAGVEIGVASTKAFSAQLMVLTFFAIKLAQIKDKISNKEQTELFNNIAQVPHYLELCLEPNLIAQIKKTAQFLGKAANILYIGRGISYPIALEGALKLKELTYIPTSGIASGELKHGTIALVDENLPVIALAPNNQLFEKSAANIEEIVARKGKVILISDKNGIKRLQNICHQSITVPKTDHIIFELLLGAIPTQLLAYYSALEKGHDVDQPRNLAKSVTVE